MILLNLSRPLPIPRSHSPFPDRNSRLSPSVSLSDLIRAEVYFSLTAGSWTVPSSFFRLNIRTSPIASSLHAMVIVRCTRRVERLNTVAGVKSQRTLTRTNEPLDVTSQHHKFGNMMSVTAIFGLNMFCGYPY